MPISYQIHSLSQYYQTYKKSIDEPEQFWGDIAENFRWKKKWENVLEWNFTEPAVKWFINGKLNITENCLDRWAESQPDVPAIIWEPNNPDESAVTLSYKELLNKVCQFAHVLFDLGVTKGDRVCIYMPMVPELPIALLACARIGAIHSVVFGGFSSQSLKDRIQDATCKWIITADGAYRGAKQINLKEIVDEAVSQCESVQKVLVLKRTGSPINFISQRDVWWHEAIAEVEKKDSAFFPAIEMDAEDMLFILYTSGSTGKPKGVVHTCGGYMIYTNYTFINVFQYQPGEVFFCTADIGWVTGHSYIVYGPLSAGATSLLFEGIPTWPDAGRLWDVVDKHQVNILYTAPTAIRSLMAYNLDPLANKKLTSLKKLGTVGEPINEEAWHWYHENIGKGNCPVVDTWWQTETGGVMISNLAGITPQKPSYATLPLPGIQPVLMDERGNEIEGSIANNSAVVGPGHELTGNLCIKFPWPGMLRTTYGDHERCRQNYFATYPGYYFTGDGCLKNHEGLYRITGRVDDVLNVSGHRIGTAEVENAIDMHDDVIECAVVGFPHDIKGQGIYAYIILNHQPADEAVMKQEIEKIVSTTIGPFSRPDKIQIVTGLPKTRSGKIMRRILRKIAEGETKNVGDVTTLLDPSVVEDIIAKKI